MNTTRRHWLKGGGFALLGTGFFSRLESVAAQQRRPISLTQSLQMQSRGSSEALLLGPQPGEEGPPPPATADRLPLEWNKATVARFKEKLAEREVEAFLVRDPLNIIYLTGYWHTTTERPQSVFMNASDADPWFSIQPWTAIWFEAGGLAAG